MTPKRAPRRQAFALLSAVCAHLLALLALGLRVPKAPPQPSPDRLPPIVLELLRPTPARPAAPASRASSRAGPTAARSNPTEVQPALPAPVASPPAPSLAESPSDCATEDLPLLTETEKVRCRNQIDADKERRLARSADLRAARQVAEAQRMAPAYRMDADRQADFDVAARAAAQQTPGLSIPGHGIGIVGVSCTQMTFPLLSGVEINPNLFAHKGKQEHKPRRSHHCKVEL